MFYCFACLGLGDLQFRMFRIRRFTVSHAEEQEIYCFACLGVGDLQFRMLRSRRHTVSHV